MTDTLTPPQDAATLRARFAERRAAGQRHKDAAAAIGVSEGAAIAAHVGAQGGALRAESLAGPWVELLQALEPCGPVLALTRNESVVHEKTGTYRNVSGSGAMGLALGEEIDLRLFFSRWHAGFAVTEAAANEGQPPSQSLQFFDKTGVAVHKIFVREATDRAAWNALVDRFRVPATAVEFSPPEPEPAVKPDAEIDAAGLTRAWSEMKDTHEFFGLLRKFEVERQQALRLVQGRFARRVGEGAVQRVLDEASVDGTPIMVFVGSPGCIQIHTGPVVRIEPMEMRGMRWLNVLDPGFNLHLRADLIEACWVVEKPTSDGVVTSLEAFDTQGRLMAMFFGARKPGQPELAEWRALAGGLA